VCPRTGMDEVEKRKILPLSGSELNSSAAEPVASSSNDYASSAPINSYYFTIFVILATEVQDVKFCDQFFRGSRKNPGLSRASEVAWILIALFFS
jgi:hypothetical protein